MTRQLSALAWLAAGVLGGAIVAGGMAGAETGTPAPGRQALTHPSVPCLTPPEGLAARVPLGDVAGGTVLALPDDLPNPLQGQPAASAAGQKLFVSMNCAGCHGYDAKGSMGPNLTDRYWRYGGTPVEVFKSIYEGRPQGMPAWGGALPAKQIWQIVAYIQSLGGTYPTDAYHQARQGDHPGELVAPELRAKRP